MMTFRTIGRIPKLGGLALRRKTVFTKSVCTCRPPIFSQDALRFHRTVSSNFDPQAQHLVHLSALLWRKGVERLRRHFNVGFKQSIPVPLKLVLTFKVHDQSETVGIFEDEVPPESGPPAHLHRSQDETHYILEGDFEFVLGERKVNAGVGSVVYVPRTMVHAFTNTGTQKGKILFIETPAGALEQFLVEFGEPLSDPSSPPEGEPDMDKLQASAQRTGGIEFV